MSATTTAESELTSYRFTITCPECGGILAHRTGSAAQKKHQRAIADCTECTTTVLIDVVVRTENRLARGGRPLERALDQLEREKEAS